MIIYIGIFVFLISQLLTILCVYQSTKKSLSAVVIGLILWEVVLFCITEGLGIGNWIGFTGILSCWAVYDGLLLICLLKQGFKPVIPDLKRVISSWTRKETCMAAIILAIAAVQLFFACVTVPYNYDSMTYHLPRILMWIQNGNIDYYETYIIRQNISPLLAELNNLHWMLLCGGDQLVNLVQYKAYLFNALLVWGILDLLGCRRIWKLISVLLYMTMSITLAESISTQTDLFACCWLFCTLYLAIMIQQKDHLEKTKNDLLLMAFLAMSVGLTYLAKANLCINSIILIIWLLVRKKNKKDKPGLLFGYTAFCGIIILLLVLPTWIRNLHYSGDIMASEYMGMIAIGTYEPRLVLMNIYKNLGDLAVLPYCGSSWTVIGEKLAGIMGVNLNDPAISFGGVQFVIYYSNNMDLAGAPGVVLLSVFVLIYTLIPHHSRANDEKYKNGSLIGSLLLSVLTTLIITRWQPWGTRLMLHACIMLVVVSGYLLDRHDRRTSVLHGVFAGLWVLLAFFTVGNTALAWKYHGQIALEGLNCSEEERFRQYFRELPGTAKDNEVICSYIMENPDIQSVGLYTGESGFEYPLMKKLLEENIELAAVTMSDQPGTEGLNKGFIPDCIISVETEAIPGKTYWCNGQKYRYIELKNSSYTKYLMYRNP